MFSLLCTLLFFPSEANAYGRRPMSAETYRTIVKLLDGTFDVPVRERTREQQSAVIRLWRGWYLVLCAVTTVMFDVGLQ